MKKLALIAATLSLAASLFAGEAAPATEQAAETKEPALWPCFFAICEWPETPQLYGLRLSLPFSTKQENVCGLDIGLWGRSRDFEGFGISILRNDVKDSFAGFQVGLYNSAQRADLFALQVGLWNEVSEVRGIQVGLVNIAGSAQGFQVGLVNCAETLYGYQIGLVNVIRDAEVPMLPCINIGF